MNDDISIIIEPDLASGGEQMEHPPISRVESVGGVSLEVPGAWEELTVTEHISAHVGPPLSSGGAGAVCLLHATPGHVSLAEWWAIFQAAAEGPLLLEARALDDGYRMVYSQLTSGCSTTSLTRVIHLPGRSLSVTVCVDSGDIEAALPLADRIVASVHVRGIP